MTKIYFALSLITVVSVNAQQFEEIQETPFKDFYYASSAVGDLNNNGFKDVFFAGAIDSDGDTNVDSTFNELYQNNNGNFSVAQSFDTNAVHLSDVKFIDFDNDGFLDMVSTGLSYNDVVNYQQYRFKNNDGTFELLESLPGKIYGGLDVFDFNHDGKQDYALNGTQYSPEGFTHELNLYLNSGSDFTETKAWMQGTQSGDFKLMDIDNDLELDLLIFGFDSKLEPIFNIYKNANGLLQLSQQLPVSSGGKMAFADFNADGFMDFVIVGQDVNFDAKLIVYMNDKTGNFNPQEIEAEGLEASSVEVGDLNNDGYYDFAVLGDDKNYDGQTKVFYYQPIDNQFVKAENTNLYNLGSGGKIQLFDYNNDNQLDVLLNGFDWSDPDIKPATKLFRNTSSVPNSKPNAPLVLNASQENGLIIFDWSGANDDKTPENALQYELTVGSQSGKSDIAKYLVTTKKWYLNTSNLPSNLFWSVKAIDASKVYSESSEEKTIALLSTQENLSSEVLFYPNPIQNILHIKTKEKINSVKVYNVSGQNLPLKLNSENTIDFSSSPKGMYLVEIKFQSGKRVTEKVLKK